MPPEVFISYSRKDSRVAEAIVKCLQASGISCWIDKKLERMPGAQWDAEIAKAIEQSKVMVLVYSRHSNASTHVADEVNLARSSNLHIIAFRLHDVPLSHGLRLALSRSQWFDAMPTTARHLQLLANDVCRVLDRATPALPPMGGLDQVRVFWHRTLASLAGKPAPQAGSGESARQPAGHADDAGDDTPLDPTTLVVEGRWYRIKTLIDARESRGLPLRRLADLKAAQVSRFEAFERARVKALAAIEHLGPEAAKEHIPKLASFVPDHPDLEVIRSRVSEMRTEHANLWRALDELKREDRWTAAENLIRRVAVQSGIASQQLLRAAEIASSRALKESRRLELLIWTVLAGVAMFVALWLAGNWFMQGLGPNGSEVRTELMMRMISMVTIPFIMAIGLACFGKWQSGAGIGFAAMWVGVGVIAAGVALVVRPDQATVPEPVAWQIYGFAAIASAIATMNLMRLGASELVSPEVEFPGAAALAATIFASGGVPFMLFGSGGGADWSAGIPEALAAATLFAVSGYLGSRRIWLMFVILEVVFCRVIASSAEQISTLAGLLFAGPLFACISWAFGQRSPLGFIWIFGVAILAFLAAQIAKFYDGSFGTQWFSQILSLWAIACGSVALDRKADLGLLRVGDWLRKVFMTRVAFAGSRLAAPRLTDTSWYRGAQSWHERRAGAEQDSVSHHKAPAGAGERGQSARPRTS